MNVFLGITPKIPRRDTEKERTKLPNKQEVPLNDNLPQYSIKILLQSVSGDFFTFFY